MEPLFMLLDPRHHCFLGASVCMSVYLNLSAKDGRSGFLIPWHYLWQKPFIWHKSFILFFDIVTLALLYSCIRGLRQYLYKQRVLMSPHVLHEQSVHSFFMFCVVESAFCTFILFKNTLFHHSCYIWYVLCLWNLISVCWICIMYCCKYV